MSTRPGVDLLYFPRVKCHKKPFRLTSQSLQFISEKKWSSLKSFLKLHNIYNIVQANLSLNKRNFKTRFLKRLRPKIKIRIYYHSFSNYFNLDEFKKISTLFRILFGYIYKRNSLNIKILFCVLLCAKKSIYSMHIWVNCDFGAVGWVETRFSKHKCVKGTFSSLGYIETRFSTHKCVKSIFSALGCIDTKILHSSD